VSAGRLFIYVVLGGLAGAAAVFVVLLFVRAPYGRHLRKGWGPLMPNALGWAVMESPAPLVFAACFTLGTAPRNLPIVLFLILWELHYVQRAFVYPLTIRDGHKKIPIAVVLMAVGFNFGNAYANGYYLFSLSGGYPLEWLQDPRFLAGAVLFLAGYIINRWGDLRLRELRHPGETVYRIPYGGLFRWVSCPNYLGEIVEWCGWALATWSLAGLAFALWTFANLAPRARSHQAWYQANFAEYPRDRKALIPGIW
jgi:protein-S-isoprenylcysteine O-methyltransferase Ste14